MTTKAELWAYEKFQFKLGEYHIHHATHGAIALGSGIYLRSRYKLLGWSLITIGAIFLIHKIYRDKPKDLKSILAMFITKQ